MPGLFDPLSYNAYAAGVTITPFMWDKRMLDACTHPDTRVSYCREPSLTEGKSVGRFYPNVQKVW